MPNRFIFTRKLLFIGMLLLFMQEYVCDLSAQQPAVPRPRFRFNPSNPTIHDPVMIKQGDTIHLLYTGMGISHLLSTDMKTWTLTGPVFRTTPPWIRDKLPGFRGHMWAPDILYYQGNYHLFYSCSAFGKNTSLIAHASIPTLNSLDSLIQWKDLGMIVQSVPYRDMWNAIDPNVLIDEDGIPWMVFGSFWNGLKLVRLTDDLKGIAVPEEWHSLCRRSRTAGLDDSDPGDGAVEAPFLFKHGAYYYLFASYDYCCRGLQSTYYVVVGRSGNVRGPYLDREGKTMMDGGGTVVIQGDDRYAGVGHCAVYHWDDTDYFVAHGYDKTENGASKLVLRRLTWDEAGWPHVESLP
jgi:arabinan endo-1,5-alpha-L-arabinosidase